MALNPAISPNGDPYRAHGEHFIMQRKGMEFEVKINGLGKFKGKGIVSI